MRSRRRPDTETPEIDENMAKNLTVAATLLTLDGLEKAPTRIDMIGSVG